MELKEALAKAGQIFDEERAAPTVRYELDAKEIAAVSPRDYAAVFGGLAVLTGDERLAGIRSQRPRPVQENPRFWAFKSINYNLLCAVSSQIAADSRATFVKGILQRMAKAECGQGKGTATYGYWHGFVSESPLIAEFCVRNSATKAFLETFSRIHASPGQIVLLEHLEDMVALNFTVFSDAEYVQLELHSRALHHAYAFECQQSSITPVTQGWAGTGVAAPYLFRHLVESADGLLEQCRKARYFYLKGSLLDGLNIEINQDKDAVQSHLRRFGFTETLAKSLDEAERLYREGSSGFDLKASMGHLRSFLEGLHKNAFPMLHARLGGAAPTTWGLGLRYLQENGVISKAEEQFAASLYTINSDQAVHPLMAEREYARLVRNVVIEYALLLLSKLEKLGLKVS